MTTWCQRHGRPLLDRHRVDALVTLLSLDGAVVAHACERELTISKADPNETRTVREVIDAGMPYVDESGIMRKIYHQRGCRGPETSTGQCACGLMAEMNRLAMEFSRTLDQYGRL